MGRRAVQARAHIELYQGSHEPFSGSIIHYRSLLVGNDTYKPYQESNNNELYISSDLVVDSSSEATTITD